MKKASGSAPHPAELLCFNPLFTWYVLVRLLCMKEFVIKKKRKRKETRKRRRRRRRLKSLL